MTNKQNKKPTIKCTACGNTKKFVMRRAAYVDFPVTDYYLHNEDRTIWQCTARINTSNYKYDSMINDTEDLICGVCGTCISVNSDPCFVGKWSVVI